MYLENLLQSILIPEMAIDPGLPEISGKFQIYPVNPSSLSGNLSDYLIKNNDVELFADLRV